GVGDGVEAGGGDALGGEGGEGNAQVSGVRDGRIGQQALDVALAQCTEVAEGHGDDRQPPQDRYPVAAQEREGSEGDAQQNGEGSGFGAGGHERDDGGGRAFVDIGRPDVERRSGNLEGEADDDHCHADVEQRLRLTVVDGGGDVGDARAAGGAVDQRDSVEEEGRGEGAEKEILERGFGALRTAAAEARHDVGGDRGDFEGDEDQQQLHGARHEHHADGSEEHEGEEFAE